MLAARQLGWAHSVPKGADGKRGEQSQIEIARDNGGDVHMPDQRCPYLFDWLCLAGPAQSGGMGPIALTAAELQAWAQGAAIYLQPWEFQVLQRASRAYCAAYSSPDDFPPFGDSDELYDDDVVAEKLSAGLSKLL